MNEDNLSEISAFYAAKKVPFIWWWLQQSELPLEIKQELDQQGFQFLGEFLGIAVILDQVNLKASLTVLKLNASITLKNMSSLLQLLAMFFN